MVAEFQPAERTPILVESGVRLKDPQAGRRVLGLVESRRSISLEHEWGGGRTKGYLRPGILSPGAILISLHAGTHVLGDGLLFIHSPVHNIYPALALALKKHTSML